MDLSRKVSLLFLLCLAPALVSAQPFRDPLQAGNHVVAMFSKHVDPAEISGQINAINGRNNPAILRAFGNPRSAKHLISTRKKLGSPDRTGDRTPEEIEQTGGIGLFDFSFVEPDSPEGKLQRYIVLEYDGPSQSRGALQVLEHNPNITTASIDESIEFSIAPNDPQYDRQWGLGGPFPGSLTGPLNLESAWDKVKGHAYVGVVDNGIDIYNIGVYSSGGTRDYPYAHPDLTKNYRHQFSYDFHDPYDKPGQDNDEFAPNSYSEVGTATFSHNPYVARNVRIMGHGTHVAGIIAADTNNNTLGSGVCWNCSIAVGKSLTIASEVANAIQWLTNNAGSQTYNMSLRLKVNDNTNLSPLPTNHCTTSPESPICLAIHAAAIRDIVGVGASGNDGQNNRIDFPAGDPRIISVGAINQYGSRAQFSNYHTNTSETVDLAAPGEFILSTFDILRGTSVQNAYPDGAMWAWGRGINCGDRYHESNMPLVDLSAGAGTDDLFDGLGACSGTSMAAPHVTGIVGLMRSVDPLLSAANVKNALFSSASHYSQKSPELGYGVPDAAAAVSKVFGVAGGKAIVNRLTPLFSFYNSEAENSLYTSNPQMAYPAMGGQLMPQKYEIVQQPQNSTLYVNFLSTSYYPAYGSIIRGYEKFPDEGFGPFPTPLAEVYIFTTDKNPLIASQPLVPLYRLSFQGDHAGNNTNLDHTYSTSEEMKQSYINAGYKLDGIEGYIYSIGYPQPPGTVKLLRRYNTSRDDHAIFPETKSTYMWNQGYTSIDVQEVIGYVYLNQDTDGDHLIDGFEQIIHTCVNNKDSDRDGLTDGAEVNGYPRTDPLDIETSCGDSPPASPSNPWRENTIGITTHDRPWNSILGYHFRPDVDGKITKLGALINGTKTVKLFNKTTGDLLVETEVTGANNWSYSPIMPVSVSANTEYTVVVYTAGSGGSFSTLGSGQQMFPMDTGDIYIIASTYGSNPNQVPLATSLTTMFGQADIEFVPDEPTHYYTVNPCRIADTRFASAGSYVAGNITRSFQANPENVNLSAQGGSAGGCGIPNTASAIHVNFTAIAPPGSGYMRAWAWDRSEPNATVFAWGSKTATNTLTIPLCQGVTCGNDFTTKVNSSGTFDMVIDVLGYHARQ